MSGLPKVLAIILLAWIVAATYGWVCKVKQLCCNDKPEAITELDKRAITPVDDDAVQRIDNNIDSIEGQPGDVTKPDKLGSQFNQAEQDNASATQPSPEPVAATDQSVAVADQSFEQTNADADSQPEDNTAQTASAAATVIEPAAMPSSNWLTSEFSVPALDGASLSKGNVRFEKGSAVGQVQRHIEQAFTELAGALKAQPNRQLLLTGGFYTDEENPSSYENLGLARAKVLAERLAREGVAEERFQLSYDAYDPERLRLVEQSAEGSTRSGPVLLKITPLATVGEATNGEIPEALRAPIVLNFETGKTYVRLSPRLRERISAAIAFLNNNDTFSASLVGHTDDQGNAENNLELGLARARSSDQLLRQFGLKNQRVRVSSQGEENPVMPNDTPANRALNRRVVFTLVKPKFAP